MRSDGKQQAGNKKNGVVTEVITYGNAGAEGLLGLFPFLLSLKLADGRGPYRQPISPGQQPKFKTYSIHRNDARGLHAHSKY